MVQGKNIVNIEGLVSEINIREIEKADKKYVAGDVIVEVEKDGVVSTIPVNFITANVTKAGQPNKLYANMLKLKEFQSIAAAGRENATKVQVRGARMVENAFANPQDKNSLVKTVRLESNFFTRVTNDFKPKAEFEIDAYIIKMDQETKMVNEEATETGRLLLTVATVGYNDRIEVLTLIADAPAKIQYIKDHWKEKDTVKIIGKINYITEVIETKREVGFGEAESLSYTKRTRELIITAGSEFAMEGEQAYTEADMANALRARKGRHDRILEEAQKPKAASATASTSWADEF